MYEMMLESCKEEFATILKIITATLPSPLLYFCQHGKDRTGLVTMLVMGCCYVDEKVKKLK